MATANITFGASGWRAVIAGEFNLISLRRAAHAAAEHLRENREFGYKGEEYLLHLKNKGRTPPKNQHIVVGYDTRYFSEEFSKTVAEVFAAEGLTVLLAKTDIPAPAVAWGVIKTNAAGGIMVTAENYPAHYSGLKWNAYWGGPGLGVVTEDIEQRFLGLTIAEAEKNIPYDQAAAAGLIKFHDLADDYIKQLLSLIDSGAIKSAGLKIATDTMHGSARAVLRPALEKLGAKVTGLREDRDVLFGGNAPEAKEENLKPLKDTVLKNKLSLGLACDGDGSSFGIIDTDGTWIAPNFVLGLALEHLVKNRGLKGNFTRSLMTSHFADAIAKKHGLTVRETPVGFNHIGNLLRTGQYLLGGEEDGGLSIANHIPEKDGILACLLMAEMAAYERKPLKKVLAELIKQTGTFVNDKQSIKVDSGVNLAAVLERLTNRPPLNLAGASVWRIDHMDGFKFIMKDGSWLGLRPSDDKTSVTLYVESQTRQKIDLLSEAGKKIINGKF